MNDDPIAELKEIATAPVKQTKRRYRRRAADKARIADPAQARSEFPGLTVWNCCDTCGPRCVITAAGTGVCAHPAKGGLQAADMLRQEVLAKFQRAKAELAKQKIDAKVGT